jgi:hypothetical protein
MFTRRNFRKSELLRALAVAFIVGAGSFSILAQNADDAGWKTIFDGKTMNGWYTYQNQAGKNADNGVFKIENGSFHILDFPAGTTGLETTGCLLTADEYSYVRVRLQYKWGTKMFARGGAAGGGRAAAGGGAAAPAAAPGPGRGGATPAKKDAGFLYYFFGEDRVWGNNIEFQIQEGDTGDLWLNGATSITATISNPSDPPPAQFTLTGGSPHTLMGSVPPGTNRPGGVQAQRVLKYADWEDADGWNTLEAVLDGQDVHYYVNGHLVNEARDAKRRDPQDPEKWIPLTSGKFCLQAEGAEVWYRNIQIKPIPDRKK